MLLKKIPFNRSWKEVGNEQSQICIAPDSSLPTLPPEDTTPSRFPLEEIKKDAEAETNENQLVNKTGKKQDTYIELEDGTSALVG